MAKKGVYTKLVLAQNGGREDDTKDYDRVSDDEYVSEDEAVKGEPIVENGSGIAGKSPGELLALPIPEVDQVLMASARARMLTEEYFNDYERKKNALMVQIKGQLWRCKKCSR